MRFAVFSDIHANLEALEAVLADARVNDCTRYVCLGDVVGYNADPVECLKIVRELGCPTVKGNHDEQASFSGSSLEFNEWAEQAIVWTRGQLDKNDRKWLRDLPLQQRVNDFTIVHASLDAPEDWNYVFTTDEAIASFRHQHTPICFFGHTHVPGVFTFDGGVKQNHPGTIHTNEGKRYFINAGSVGQPRDGDWRAAYCIFYADENIIEQRRVPYDIDRARKKIIAAGLPRLLADRLQFGR